MHLLGSLMPAVPLATKQLWSNVVKMVCELVCGGAILFSLVCSMQQYKGTTGGTEGEQRLRDSEAEMLYYAIACLVSTCVAMCQVLFMLLWPNSPWVRVQLVVERVIQSFGQRVSNAQQLRAENLRRMTCGLSNRSKVATAVPSENGTGGVVMEIGQHAWESALGHGTCSGSTGSCTDCEQFEDGEVD